MTSPGQNSNPADPDDLADLPDDLRESIQETSDNEFGDETQSNEERTAEEGLDAAGFIDPRGEDEPEDD